MHKNLVTVLNEEEVKNNCKIAKTEIDKKLLNFRQKYEPTKRYRIVAKSGEWIRRSFTFVFNRFKKKKYIKYLMVLLIL